MPRIEVLLSVDGTLLMAPNNPIFLAALRKADLGLLWNHQFHCWWAPAYRYFELMSIVRRFFPPNEEYPDDYVLQAVDPFRRYPLLRQLTPQLKAGEATLRERGGELFVVLPEQGPAWRRIAPGFPPV